MALSIKTDEADRLARELSRLTGETMTQAVTVALRERLERAREAAPPRRTPEEIEARVKEIQQLTARMRANMIDTSPVTKAEWDEISGEHDLDADGERYPRSRRKRPGDAAA